MKSLIIVESPTKARTLSKFLGSDYQIEATMGHVRDLPEKKVGVEIKEKDGGYDFIPEYVQVLKKEDIVSKLEEEAKKADEVILATDPDREGEAIAWHVNHLLKGKKNASRIVFHEITESAIKDAINNPRTIDMNLVDSQQARRILDRLVGYKLSPLLWRKIRRGLSAGRVQSVAVRLIVEREREIEAFKPEEYWTIQAELEKTQPTDTNNKLTAQLTSKDEKKIEIKNKEQADQLLAELNGLTYRIKDIKIDEFRKSPYPPFTTSTMQQAASNVLGWSAKRTMQIAQGLYEQGLITYHRTDSLNLAQQAVDSCRAFIEKDYGRQYLPESLKIYKTKSKVAQEAHEAIRPTKVEDAGGGIGARDEKKLYELIWKRFVACQMSEAVYDQTRIDIEAGTYLFRANGSKLKFDGWKKIYGANSEEEEEKENELPNLSINELLKLIKLLPNQHFTEPPARYTEATLIKALEEKGIGRPSTYAPIISTIQDRQYVEKTDRKFQPTVLGNTVSDFLVNNFPEIVDVGFTAKMEDELDSIANGENKWVPVLSDFYGPFDKKLISVQENSKRVAVPVEQTDEKCEACGAPLVIRIGRFGKFLACSRFPECKFTKTFVNKTGMTCPKCGGEIILKKTKKKRSFYGCSNYPKCDFAAWKKEDILNFKS